VIEPDIECLKAQLLVSHCIAKDDYAVNVRDLPAGRIRRDVKSGNRMTWLWTVTGPYVPPELQPGHGEAETLSGAKLMFRAKFDSWMAYAETPESKRVWHRAVPRIEVGCGSA
jgi:putative SOS response-associated peptidase YedK